MRLSKSNIKDLFIIEEQPNLCFIKNSSFHNLPIKIINYSTQIENKSKFHLIDGDIADISNFEKKTLFSNYKIGIKINSELSLENQIDTIIQWKKIIPNLIFLAKTDANCDLKTLYKLLRFRFDGFVVKQTLPQFNKNAEKLYQLISGDLQINKSNEIIKELETNRSKLKELDYQIVEIISKRIELIEKIAIIKNSGKLNILQESKWLSKIDELSVNKSFNPELIKSIFKIIHIESIEKQLKVLN